MYKQIFQAPVPYRMPDDPTLTGQFGQVIYPPLLAHFTTPPRIYGEEFDSVNAMFVKKGATATSPATITLNAITNNIYDALVGQTITFDGATGALIGYGDYIGNAQVEDIVQSTDGSLWSTRNGILYELDQATHGVLQTIAADFFEIPADQTFHGIVHPMVDRARGLIVMSGYPPLMGVTYILVNDLRTGALIRRIWVSGPVNQIMQEDDRRCFVICTNGVMNVVDYTTGAIISTTRTPLAGAANPFKVIYAWDPTLRRLLGFNFVNVANPDGSSPNSIVGFYPVPLATNITKPIPLKPPRKGRTVPVLVRAVGDAGEPIPSLPLTAAATEPGAIASGSRITDSYGYATINLTGTDAGSSEVTVAANVDDGASGVVVGGGTGGGTGGGSGGGSGGGTGTSPVAPTLSAAIATQTGTTTATGSVSTNQGNGTLYTLFSANATATATEVKAGRAQGVTATGTQNVSVTGLTASTTYYPHYLHRNSSGLESAVATGASFMTLASGGGSGGGGDTGGGSVGGGTAPTVPAVAIGSALTTVDFTNYSGSTVTNAPVTFGHVFQKGALPSVGAAVALEIGSTTVPAQIDVKATNADGSVRHAIISAIIPNIAGSATATCNLLRVTAGTSTPAVPSDFSGMDAVASINIGGTAYSASLADVLTSSSPKWLSGNVVTEWLVSAPLKTSGGTAHPLLHARFYVRGYKGQNKAKIDVVIENTWVKLASSPASGQKGVLDNSINTVTGNVTISVAGTQVYTENAVAHPAYTRWKKTVWWNASDPVVLPKLNLAYLLSTYSVPNYDTSIVPTAGNIASYLSDFNSRSTLMGQGLMQSKYMPQTGGRLDIALIPAWDVVALLSQHKDIVTAARGTSDRAGAWSIHYRNYGTDRPLSLTEAPYFSASGAVGGMFDAIDPTTNVDWYPPPTNGVSDYTWDSAHHPDLNFISYLTSGDYYYKEGLQFWATGMLYSNNPAYRQGAKGIVVSEGQTRDMAWSLRTLAHAAYISPDSDSLKGTLTTVIQNNIDYAATRFYNNPSDGPSKLGIMTHGEFYNDNQGHVTNPANEVRGIAPWQDDHLTSAVGRMLELGFNAQSMFAYKSKFVVNRLTSGSSFCYVFASMYAMMIKDKSANGGAYFTTMGQVYQASVWDDVKSLPCGSLAMAQAIAAHGNTNTTQAGQLISEAGNNAEDMPNLMQPSVAYAKTFNVAGGADAWLVYSSAPSYKPNGIAHEPQFSILPRLASTTTTPPLTTTPPPASTRDPLKQPFASTSIWNMPIGSGAQYVPAGLSANPAGSQFAFMPGADGEQIVLTPTAPLTDIRYSSAGWSSSDRCVTGGATLVQVPMPGNFTVPNSTHNNGAAFLKADGRTIVQVQPLARCSVGGYATALVKAADVDLYGPGITGMHGGSGLSSIGGSIRLGELRPGQQGPKHALKVNVYAKGALYKATTRAEGFRWPATTCDSYAVGWYGTDGNNLNTAMKQGALLAIPASVDINSLGLVTEPAKQIAWTLQNYGAYIVDDAYAPGFDFSLEDGAAGSKAAEFKADFGFDFAQRLNLQTQWVKDIQKIVAALHVVDNNSSSNIGGGGTPRQPLAPAISAP